MTEYMPAASSAPALNTWCAATPRMFQSLAAPSAPDMLLRRRNAAGQHTPPASGGGGVVL